jgi:2-polyprenyl-3-methyl-5-hydroxy-6-metoxy-1,4-benzoquinol methylase
MDTPYSSLSEQYSSKPEGYYENARPEMVPFVPERCKLVLEVGCSSGAFGKLLKESRPECEVWGIEPNAEAAQLASTRLDKAICGTFRAGIPELEGCSFDCIVFNDVLEHVPYPEQILEESKQYLSANGMVVASIPNILHFYQISKILLEQDWRYEDSGIMDNTHLRFFTKKSIMRMFDSCGYDITVIKGINPSAGMKFKLANSILLGRLSDWRFLQFAVQAKSRQEP